MAIVEIPLTKGQIAIIDEEDLPIVAGFNWCAAKRDDIYYACSTNKGLVTPKMLLMHRLIMGVTDPKVQVDHWDTNGLNNRRLNLRIATKSQNQGNSRKTKGLHSSRFKGVCFSKNTLLHWAASITIDHKKRYLGTYATEEEAAKVYDRAAVELFGEFARLNLPIQ